MEKEEKPKKGLFANEEKCSKHTVPILGEIQFE